MGDELVGYWFTADGVAVGVVCYFYGAVEVWCCQEAGGLRDGGLGDGVEVTCGISEGMHFGGVGFFEDDGVGVAVNRGVDADAENVLVVLGEDTGVDDVAVGRGFSGVDVDD